VTKPCTYVHSTFVQPSVTCSGVADQYTSNWVGLDGFNDQTVAQDGTFAWCGGTDHTTPKYEAWYEMYPANSVNIARNCVPRISQPDSEFSWRAGVMALFALAAWGRLPGRRMVYTRYPSLSVSSAVLAA
jgi:hypothetical protein